jgi:hypothetical protein
MEHLAAAVVNAFAFLALSDEATVNEDEACRMMEALAAELRLCTPAERAALEQAAYAEHARQQAAHAGPEVLEFYAGLSASIFEDN